MKILIALDATPPCAKIVEEAVNRPWPSDSAFFLLQVLDPFRFVKAPISLQRAKDAASAKLGNLKKALADVGWKVEADVILGHPRSAIVIRAASWKADLVMLGSSDPGPVARLLLGSTAHAVLRRSPCSVEIVRPQANGKRLRAAGMKILVATDGSEYSRMALHSVVRRPWPEGSEVKVLCVPEPFAPVGFPYFELKEIEDLNTSALKQAKKAVDAGARILTKLDAKVSTETPLPQDSPARVIVKEAQEWGAHMIVLGSHGRRGFDRLMMGSVSAHVAFHAHCSVEVIRGRNRPREEIAKRRKSMKVKDVMMGTPYYCQPDTNLGSATELMWVGNCGFVPVMGTNGKIVGVVTDRDICIALGTRNRLPGDVTAGEVMSNRLFACSPDDDVHVALRTMQQGGVRRLPVIVENGTLVGVISMDDLLLRAEAAGIGKQPELSTEEVVSTYRAIDQRRVPQIVLARGAA